MSNRAIYHIIEQDQDTWLHSYYGGNALSPLLRLQQAQEIAEQMREHASMSAGIGHIFAHLTYAGNYVLPRLQDDDMFCEPLSAADQEEYRRMFSKSMQPEMCITLDIPKNSCLLEFNTNVPSYRHMGVYSIPIDIGLDNVTKLCQVAEKKGIEDFGWLCQMYYQATGLFAALEGAQGNYEVEQLYIREQKGEPDARSHELDVAGEMEV